MKNQTLIKASGYFAIPLLYSLSTAAFCAPPVPTLAAPQNYATNVSQSNVYFNWYSSGATSYRIVISQNPSFSGFVDNNGSSYCSDNTCYTTTTTSGSYYKTMSLSGQKYYWKVRANNSTGASGWSSPWSFTTAGNNYGQSIWSEALRAYNNGERKSYKREILADGKYTYCARHVRLVHNLSAKYSTAANTCQNYANKGLINKTSVPPVGAAVCYTSSAPYTGGAGHIAIADGNGKELGVTSPTYGVQSRSSLLGTYYYWGWVSASDFKNNF